MNEKMTKSNTFGEQVNYYKIIVCFQFNDRNSVAY